MKGFFYFLLYSFILLLIGRNLAFLPQINLKSPEQRTADIKKEVQKYLSKQQGDFSVYYKDINSGKEFGIDENKVLTGASLNKIFISGYMYSLAKGKKINLEDKIIIQKDDIQDYGTGSLRYGGAGKSYSLKTLNKLSLNQSDNTAAHVLGVRTGLDNIGAYIHDLGLTSSDITGNKTTPKEIGEMLILVYTNKITNIAYTQELLDFMKDTDFEDRIPRFLDKQVTVYHKTGDAANMVHDAAIIDDKKNPFVLVVMSNDIQDVEKAKEVIGRIAEIVYENR